MKNTQKGFIVPLLIIIVVLAIGSGVYFYTQNKSQQQTSNSQATTTVQVSNTQNIVPTSTVQTVTTSIPSNSKKAILTLEQYEAIHYPGFVLDDSAINTMTGPQASTLCPNTKNNLCWHIEAKNVTITSLNNNFYCGDKVAQTVQFVPPKGVYQESLVDCGAYYFIFTFSDPGPRLNGPFIPPSTISLGWQTYNNSQYGLSFQYPSYFDVVESNCQNKPLYCHSLDRNILGVVDKIATDNHFSPLSITYYQNVPNAVKVAEADFESINSGNTNFQTLEDYFKNGSATGLAPKNYATGKLSDGIVTYTVVVNKYGSRTLLLEHNGVYEINVNSATHYGLSSSVDQDTNKLLSTLSFSK
jgi:hypothetical protein